MSLVAPHRRILVLKPAVAGSTLRREADGTVTVVNLASAWTAIVSRQADGSVTVSGY